MVANHVRGAAMHYAEQYIATWGCCDMEPRATFKEALRDLIQAFESTKAGARGIHRGFFASCWMERRYVGTGQCARVRSFLDVCQFAVHAGMVDEEGVFISGSAEPTAEQLADFFILGWPGGV
jgi:hypothetical protein